jgi:PEP-utilizing family enzyme
VKYLHNPQAVIQLIQSGKLKDHILLVRGGTTTFLAPALSMGAIGVITMSGAPESHLGILSREFQTPCVMTVHLTGGSGSRYVPGETPDSHFDEIVAALDGKTVTLDCSDHDTGKVVLTG